MKNNEQNDDEEFESQLIASEKYAEGVSQYIEKNNKKVKSKNNRKIKTQEEKLQAKLKREEKKRQAIIDKKIEYMREDLKEQLDEAGMFGQQFDDMVENYLYFVRLKENLQYDIEKNGIRYPARTGNGYITDKPNESVKNLTNVNAEMRSIIKDLGLKSPKEPEEGEGDDLL